MSLRDRLSNFRLPGRGGGPSLVGQDRPDGGTGIGHRLSRFLPNTNLTLLVTACMIWGAVYITYIR